MNNTGRIHSFESFGTVDGPGIRFIVFMQGCPLKCVYCHNRDMWDSEGGKEYTPEQVIEEMKKYINYIEFSGGGITVTGGEPLLQVDFVTELFKIAKKMGIHTAIDTSGFAKADDVRELLEYTDLVLLDIKSADKEKHKRITGVENEKITKFAKYLSDTGIPIWIRYVLVPGLTDEENDLKKVANFIRGLKTVENIEVLPYHTMGAYKWEKLGYKYQLEEVKVPDSVDIKNAKKMLDVL
ncbi:pyruvate formate-lyase-activating protein [Herbivorax sp. ANBcel31]|uniref:pyruvate formate-lyase-activating protein n=1 Tax=Herbivorax sp. ANBcel31 TaxID=3069754 RepID=UPI0027AF824D|nr:pyruvate formate-lyase-activating protein [Herbivorax sp. ANBcel31]MDQ2085860.1 pyruvate formate-lyase-activating protein [Herbivorax sp. ANBcel31]